MSNPTSAELVSGYRAELARNWRPLLGATLGLSSGLSLNAFVVSVFGPALLAAFGWSKSQFALVGMLSLLTMIAIPVVGRLTDLFGVRRVAVVGVVCYPLSTLALTFMSGDINEYYLVSALQLLLCATTTVTVYSRVVAERFHVGRGFALASFACGPPIASAIGNPLLAILIDEHGWRAGYYALTAYSTVLGLLTLLLLPAGNGGAAAAKAKRSARGDYAVIFRTPAFWIVLISCLLCSFPFTLLHSQLAVMLQEHQVSATQTGFMLSIFSVGVIVGRFVSGVALDRFPTHLVAAIGMGVPCVGLFILATPQTDIALVILSVALLGLSFGSEADILSYTAARYFPMDIYSSVLGLLMVSVGIAMTLGSAILSVTLKLTDSFGLFMLIAGGAVLVGGLNLLRLKGVRSVSPVLPG